MGEHLFERLARERGITVEYLNEHCVSCRVSWKCSRIHQCIC